MRLCVLVSNRVICAISRAVVTAVGWYRTSRTATVRREQTRPSNRFRIVAGCLGVLLLAVGAAGADRPAWGKGLAGNALQFDGGSDTVGDFVRIPDDASLTLVSYTLEAWVLLDPADVIRQPFISKGPDFGNYTLGVLGDGTPEYVHQTTEGNYSCCPALARVPFGVWTHVAVTHDAGTTRIYLNGQLNGSGSFAPPQVLNMFDLVFGAAGGPNSPMFGPAVGSGWSDFHSGLLDEVRIWNFARTDLEIAGSYNRIVNPGTPGLVGYWNFNEAFDDQTVLDVAPLGGFSTGTLGSDLFEAADDPLRVDSTAPLIADFAACPADDDQVRQIFADAGAAARDSYILAYSPGTSDSGLGDGQGAGLCAGPGFDEANGGSVRQCVTISTDPDACFPSDPARAKDAFGMQTQQRVSVSGSVCTIHCFTIDGMRVCKEVCVTE